MASGSLQLTDLQYNLKKDPATYKPDFERYYEHFQALEQSFVCAPSQFVEKLEELLLFLSQVIQFYPDYVERFSADVLQTLMSRSFGLHPQMRAAFMKAFMRLKTKDLIPLSKAVDVAFKLHRCQDKQVRQTMRNFVVHDIKRLNRREKLSKLNACKHTSLKFLRITIPLNVWNDSRTANLIADACLAKRKKVYAPAVRFFLGQDVAADEKDSDSESESDTQKETKIKQLRLGHRVGCKTKRREKRLERNIKNVEKAEERKSSKQNSLTNLAAINLLHDPQTFAERLLHKLERCGDRFEIRLFLLDLITRLVGFHKLILLNLYPFLQRFLRPHQREVTRLLLFAAQASHDEVPPDVMEPLVRTVADNFVTERASSEAIAVGLNAVREICARCPYAVNADLLSDLIAYRTYKNKNVVASARSVIRLYRQINPSLLPRKERGRPTEAQLDVLNDHSSAGVALTFGQTAPVFTVPGAEAIALAETVTSSKMNKSSSEKQNSKRRQFKDQSSSEKDDVAPNEDVSDAEVRDAEKMDGVEEDDDGSWESCADDKDDEEISDDNGDDGQEDVAESVSLSATKRPSSRQQTRNMHDSDDDDEWIDLPHSSDEEQQLVEEKTKLDQVELKSKALEIASSRVFTQEEFEAMRRYQQTKQKRFAAAGTHKRRADDSESFFVVDSDEDEDDHGKGPELVSMSAIMRMVKKPRQSKAERLEAIHDGREGREKYGYKVNRMNPHASTTNREKSKRKAFPMIKHKVKQKAKRSFRDKQIALRDQLRHMIKHMH
ncbi:Protein required for actin cytoskeleton organization and cell cycle progression [Fasciola hepatica]|uniref:Protein SDA1 n=1 Tax=Fasciola hepatica TaxID=6192 RepID=A0A4E0R1T7_FASHE|nr:Protein required for actin cytoskeleton organization and cell cycle progression [Fasciola hepatica]